MTHVPHTHAYTGQSRTTRAWGWGCTGAAAACALWSTQHTDRAFVRTAPRAATQSEPSRLPWSCTSQSIARVSPPSSTSLDQLTKLRPAQASWHALALSPRPAYPHARHRTGHGRSSGPWTLDQRPAYHHRKASDANLADEDHLGRSSAYHHPPHAPRYLRWSRVQGPGSARPALTSDATILCHAPTHDVPAASSRATGSTQGQPPP